MTNKKASESTDIIWMSLPVTNIGGEKGRLINYITITSRRKAWWKS